MYRLLIAEDEDFIRRGLRNQVPWNKLGFEIAGEADNGKDALELIPCLHPDVVLTDIRMQVMDGIELMAGIRRLSPDIKIVIFSGYSDFEYARKGLEYGAFEYILKPTRDSEIIEVFLKLKNELDRKAADKIKIEQYKKQADDTQALLKDLFFKDLLKGKFADNSVIIKHASDLGILFEEYYTVLLLEADTAGKKTDVDIFSAKDDINKTIYKNFKSFPELRVVHFQFDEKTNTVVLILGSGIPTNKRDIAYITEKIKADLIELSAERFEKNVVVTAGISNACNDISKLSISYQEAGTALENSFFSGKGYTIHICDCNSGYTAKKNELLQINDDEEKRISEKLIKCIIKGDSNTLHLLANNYFNRWNNLKHIDKESVFMKTAELIMHLGLKLSEKGIEFDGLHEEYEKIYKRKKAFDTLQELKEWSISIFIRTIEYLKDNASDDKSNTVERLKKYINANYFRKITLDEIAEIAFMNPSYLSTFFKQKTGFTLTDYVAEVRIEKAKELLAKLEYKVYEIAMKVGYDDFRHFSKMFKRFEGVNPVEYRIRKIKNAVDQ